jgi:lyso-ornithine lipid O-acyltransferase
LQGQEFQAMSVGRSFLRTAVLVYEMFSALANFGWIWVRAGTKPTQLDRSQWLHRRCTRALRRLGVEVTVEGPLPARGLVVSNHLSYLDILMFSAAVPCVFVSKSEVGSWPLVGLLTRLSGTILVNRQRRTQTVAVRHEMEQSLQAGVPVILFAEGTSTDGSHVLPFRTALFEPAVSLGLTVTPARIAYSLEGGSVAMDVCYWGDMTLMPHVLKLFAKGKLVGHIRFSSKPAIYRDRKEAAVLAREEVLALADEPAINLVSPDAPSVARSMLPDG